MCLCIGNNMFKVLDSERQVWDMQMEWQKRKQGRHTEVEDRRPE